MNKFLIIGIIIAVLIIALLGIFFWVGNSGTTNQSGNNSNNFQVQGMQATILQEGSGSGAKNGDMVTVHYTGTLANGTKFDSSLDRNKPFTFKLGEGRVIKGWDLGVVGMKVGEKRKLTIPAELAYGATGFPPIIPTNAVLNFEVELLKIN